MKPLAVQPWPGPAPAPQDGLFAILIRAAKQRDAARSQIRLASREALAAVLRRPVDDIVIASTPGTPPRVLLAGLESRIGCSFSHEDGYSLAAINLQGPIGADLMRIQITPDWQTVARDYLGPGATAALQAAANLPLAFAQAWTRREAALKCHAQHISEWQNGLAGQSIALSLPVPGLAGHLHIGDRSA